MMVVWNLQILFYFIFFKCKKAVKFRNKGLQDVEMREFFFE